MQTNEEKDYLFEIFREKSSSLIGNLKGIQVYYSSNDLNDITGIWCDVPLWFIRWDEKNKTKNTGLVILEEPTLGGLLSNYYLYLDTSNVRLKTLKQYENEKKFLLFMTAVFVLAVLSTVSFFVWSIL